VALTPYPAVASLLGAARRARGTGVRDVIAVADLGHTSIKTAIAERGTAGLKGLRLLDARAAPPRRSPDEVEDAVADALVDVATRAAEARSRPVPLVCSVSSYVAAGVPVEDGQGVYGGLANRVGSLHRRVAAGSCAHVTLEFVHDGTAAAATAESMNSATITVGTWLGVGFQPTQGPPLLDLASDLSVHG
jgi:hypothetical protein